MGGTSTDGRFIVWSCVSTAPCGASGKCVAGWFEVETRYWVVRLHAAPRSPGFLVRRGRSEEHTSELQSRGHLVCRLLLEKKKYRVKCAKVGSGELGGVARGVPRPC